MKELEEVQKQLEKRILEMEKINRQEQETRGRAIDELEKQVRHRFIKKNKTFMLSFSVLLIVIGKMIHTLCVY